jgi:hypothetical protein
MCEEHRWLHARKHIIGQQAEVSLIYIVLCHAVQNDRDTSQTLSHITARHLITCSRVAKVQTSTLNVWYSAKHTARAAWWIMGFVRLISQFRSRSVGEQNQAHSKSQVALTFCLCELVRIPALLSRTDPPSTCAARARIPEQPSHNINCHVFLKLGTEQHKTGISKSSNSAKHTEAWWLWIPSQTHQGRSSLSIDYAEAWHRT